MIAGDFNLLPGSAIHQFLEKGVLDWSCLDYKTMSGYFRERSMDRQIYVDEERIHIGSVSSGTEFVDDDLENETREVRPVHAEQRDQFKANQHNENPFGGHPQNGRTNRENHQVNRSNPGDNSKILTHGLKLNSVFKSSDSRNQPLVTTKHDRACEMVDYVFYHQTDELSLVGFRKLLNNERSFRELPYMPNELIGSDHFSLVAKFKLHNRKTNG